MLACALACESRPASSPDASPTVAQPSETPPAPAPKAKLTGFVSVPSGTRLHTDASASSFNFELELATLSADKAPEAVFEILGERDGWVELRSLGEPADPTAPEKPPAKADTETQTCLPKTPGLEHLRLTFFVPRTSVDESKVTEQIRDEAGDCPRNTDANRFGIRGPSDAVEPLPPLQAGIRASHEHDHEWEVTADAKVYWPDGAMAGRTLATHRYMSAPVQRGEQQCVEARIGAADKAQLSVCFKPEAIQRVEYSDPRQAALDRAIAHNAGILGMLSAEGDMGALSAFGDLGDDDFGALLGSNLEGEAFGGYGLIGEYDGGGGLGGLGGLGAMDGAGGGGTAEGLGGLGTKGQGRGSGYGRGYGPGLGGAAGPRVQVKAGPVTATGEIDSDVARRMIRRQLNQFRYCYERAQQRDPELKRASVSISIEFDDEGNATTTTVTGSGNAELERCVQRAARRMRMPKGGSVQASLSFDRQ